MYKNDTIAAVSTPYGTGAIAIVRMSGKDSFEIASSVLKCSLPFAGIKSHRAVHARVIDPETGETVDDVIVIKMASPGTYTGEDTVEINCHGGIVVQKRILNLLLRNGARPAEPGEFTKRAFLNGRMDLSQAEAVADLICAKTELSSRTAVRQLEGMLSEMLGRIRESLVSVLAGIDAAIDYPDQGIDEITGTEAREEITSIISRLKELIEQFEKGKILREGVNAVIAGRPNVGKSSLLNRLARAEKAIVTDIPGTTRDIIEEYISVGGIPVRVADTAGITETPDRVEQIGVEKAYKSIEEADLVILVLDASRGVGEEERELLQKVSGKRHIVVLNKMDLVDSVSDVPGIDGIEAVPASMLDGTGIDELEKKIVEMFFEGIGNTSDILVTNARHRHLLENALKYLENAVRAHDDGMPLDIMAIDVMEAAQSIGAITGESIAEEVLDEIFSRFCIGK